MKENDNQKTKRLAARLIGLAVVLFAVAPLVEWLISPLHLGPRLWLISAWGLIILIGVFAMQGVEMIARRLGWYSKP